jgi:hypothetical protein
MTGGRNRFTGSFSGAGSHAATVAQQRATRRRRWRVAIFAVQAMLRLRRMLLRAVGLTIVESKALDRAWLFAVTQTGGGDGGAATAGQTATLAADRPGHGPETQLALLTTAKGLVNFLAVCGVRADVTQVGLLLKDLHHHDGAVVSRHQLHFIARRCKARHIAMRGGALNSSVQRQAGFGESATELVFAVSNAAAAAASEENDIYGDIYDAVREHYHRQRARQNQFSYSPSASPRINRDLSPKVFSGDFDHTGAFASGPGSPTLLASDGDAVVTDKMVQHYVQTVIRGSGGFAAAFGSSAAGSVRAPKHTVSGVGARRGYPVPSSSVIIPGAPETPSNRGVPPRLSIFDSPSATLHPLDTGVFAFDDFDDGKALSKNDMRSVLNATMTPTSRIFDQTATPAGTSAMGAVLSQATIGGSRSTAAGAATADVADASLANHQQQSTMLYSGGDDDDDGTHAAMRSQMSQSAYRRQHRGSAGPGSVTGLGPRRSRLDSLASQFSVVTASSGSGGTTHRGASAHHHQTAIEKACALIAVQLRDLADLPPPSHPELARAEASFLKAERERLNNTAARGSGRGAKAAGTAASTAAAAVAATTRVAADTAVAPNKYAAHAFPTLMDRRGHARPYTIDEVERRIDELDAVDEAQWGGLTEDEDRLLARRSDEVGAAARLRLASKRRRQVLRRQPLSRAVHYCVRPIPNAPDATTCSPAPDDFASRRRDSSQPNRSWGSRAVESPLPRVASYTPTLGPLSACGDADVLAIPRPASVQPTSRANRVAAFKRVNPPPPLGDRGRADGGVLNSTLRNSNGHRDISGVPVTLQHTSLYAVARAQTPGPDAFRRRGEDNKRGGASTGQPELRRFASLALQYYAPPARPGTATAASAAPLGRAQDTPFASGTGAAPPDASPAPVELLNYYRRPGAAAGRPTPALNSVDNAPQVEPLSLPSAAFTSYML